MGERWYNVKYKMLSSTKFVLNRIKLIIVKKLKTAYKNKEFENNKYENIIKKITKEKSIQKYSFSELFLFYKKIILCE